MSSAKSSSIALLSAVKKEDYDQTEKLLSENGLSINDKWNDYKILIHAVNTGYTKIVKLLLRYGCRVKSSKSNYCKTPLCYAVDKRNLEMVKVLLDAGASISDKDRNVDTPPYMAMKNKFFTAVDLMLSKYNVHNIDITSIDEIIHFYIACTRNNVNLVKSFIRCGMDVNTRVNFDAELWPGYSPLHFAVEYKCVEVVELLLSYGADYTFLNAKKWSPLHLAYYLEDSEKKFQMMDYILVLHNTNAADPVDYMGISHFHIACTRHNKETVKNFLKNGSSVNSSTLDGCYPLHFATTVNQEGIVEILLNHGASINAKFKNLTPLHIAVGRKSSAIVKLLLAYGANICAKGPDDCTPIHTAYYHLLTSHDLLNSMMSVHQGKMINVTDNSGFSIFHIACAVGDTAAVENFIQRKVDINAPVGLDFGSLSGFTALHLAAMYYHEEVIKVLMKNKVNVNAVDKEGRSAIWLAVELIINETVTCKLNDNLLKKKSSYEEANITEEEVMNFMYKEIQKIPIVKLLAENGSNLNCSNEEGIPLLFKAYNPDIVWEGIDNFPNKNFIQSICKKYNSACRREILEILINNGIDISMRDGNQDSILHRVALNTESNENLEIARILLANGCDPNFKNKEKSTALHFIAYNGLAEYAKLFLEYKANPNCTDECLATPLHYAAGRSCTDNHEVESPHAKIVRLLIENGADVNVKNEHGYTPVFAAVHHRWTTRELLYLLKANCQVNLNGDTGMSPLMVAAWEKNPFAVKLLLAYGADINFNCTNERGLLLSVYSKYISDDFCDYFFMETFKVLEMHIEKLRLINYPMSHSDLIYRETLGMMLSEHVNATNVSGIFQIAARHFNSDFNLPEKVNYITPMLQAELEKMKKKKIDGYTSLYNILFKTQIQMAKHVKNEIFNEYLEEGTLHVEFQHYGFLLRLKHKQGMNRYVLLEPAKESFRQLIGLDLPDLCLDGIFVCLSNEDLERLTDVYVREYVITLTS